MSSIHEKGPSFSWMVVLLVGGLLLLATPQDSSAQSTIYVKQEGEERIPIQPLSKGSLSVDGFYNYGVDGPRASPPDSLNGEKINLRENGVSHLFFYKEEGRDISFVALHGITSDGKTEFSYSGLPPQSSRVVRDDDPGNDSYSNAGASWEWGDPNTDGVAWKGGFNRSFKFTIDPDFQSGVQEWVAVKLEPEGEGIKKIPLDTAKVATITTRPEITSLRPQHGAPGSRVRVRGANFRLGALGGNNVEFGEIAAAPDSARANVLYMKRPEGPRGPVDVTVETADFQESFSGVFGAIESGGGFFPEQSQIAGLDAFSVYATDLDGDGDQDALSASREDGVIAWHRNELEETGSFSMPREITSDAERVRSVRAADLNGDGAQDVISASFGDNTVAWYENKLEDTGAFSSRKVISDGAGGAFQVHAADLDGDGDLDVLSASADDDKIAWYENQLAESGDFSSQKIITTEATGARSVHTADLDGDGDLDVLSASRRDNEVTRYENRIGEEASSNWRAENLITDLTGAFSVYAVDLDRDGDQDVVAGSVVGPFSEENSRIEWYENRLDETGSFSDRKVIAFVGGGAASVRTADLNGDRVQDVLSASRGGVVHWYETQIREEEVSFSEKTVTTNVDDAISVHVADLNKDAKLDVLSASAGDDKIAWHENADAKLYVDQDATGSADGSSWDSAYRQLQNALHRADTSDAISEIWVAEGTYHPDEGDSVEEGRRDTSFALQNGVAIYGGFRGTEKNRSERDPESKRTVLSGEIQQDADSTNNSYHVVSGSRTDSSAILDGVVVRDGQADGRRARAYGGGLFVDRGGPTIRNVTFRGNFGTDGGGVALVNFGTDSEPGAASLSDVQIIKNKTKGRGGGAFISGTDAQISRAEFRGNEALLGGGLAVGSQATVRAASSLFSGNFAETSGGAIQSDQTGFTSDPDTLSLLNTTIAGNRSPRGGGLALEGRFDVNLANSIVWNNSRKDGGQIITEEATLRNRRSAIQGRDNFGRLTSGSRADAIIRQSDDPSVYPRFVRPVLPGRAPTIKGDFHLQEPTLLEDAGTSAQISSSARDLDGGSRVSGENVDLGAYEDAVSTAAPNFTVTEKRVPESLVNGTELENSIVGKNVALRFQYTGEPSIQPDQLFVYRASETRPLFKRIAEIPAPDDLTTVSEYVDTSAEPGGNYRYAIAVPGEATLAFSRQMSSVLGELRTPLVGGTVLAESGDRPIQDALITVENAPGAETETDRKGRYLLTGLKAGVRGYKIAASASGDSKTKKLQEVLSRRQRRVRTVNFRLETVRVEGVRLVDLEGLNQKNEMKIPIRGKVYRYYRVLEDGDDNEVVPGVEVEGTGERGGESVCSLSGVSDENGIVSIKIEHNLCIEEPGAVVNVSIYRSPDVEISNEKNFEISGKAYEYKKKWVFGNEVIAGRGQSVPVGAAVQGVELQVGAETQEVWEAILKYQQGREGSVAGPDTRITKIKTGSDFRVGIGGEIFTSAPIGLRKVQAGPAELEAETTTRIEAGYKAGTTYGFGYQVRPGIPLSILFNDFAEGIVPVPIQELKFELRKRLGQDPLNEQYVGSKGVRYVEGGATGGLNLGLVKEGAQRVSDGSELSTIAVGVGAEITSYGEFETSNNVEKNEATAKTKAIASSQVATGGIGSFLLEYLNIDNIGNSISKESEIKFENDEAKSISFSIQEMGNIKGGKYSGQTIQRLREARKLTVKTSNTQNLENLADESEFVNDLGLAAASVKGGEINPFNEDISSDVRNLDLRAALGGGSFDKASEEIRSGSYQIEKSEYRSRNYGVEGSVNLPDGRTFSGGWGPKSKRIIAAVREKGKIVGGEKYKTVVKEKLFDTHGRKSFNITELIKRWLAQIPEELARSAQNFVSSKIEPARRTVVRVGEALLEIPGETATRLREDAERCLVEDGAIECVESGASGLGETIADGIGTVGANFGLSQQDQGPVIASLSKEGQGKTNTSPNPDFGISGFLRVSPHGLVMPSEPAEIEIGYEDTISTEAEKDLALYRKRIATNGWKYLGGTVRTDSNRVSATADTLTTFAVAPTSQREIETITLASDSIPADGKSTVSVDVGPIKRSDGSDVPDGSLYTVSLDRGSVVQNDAGPSTPGTQIPSTSGRIEFSIQSGRIPGLSLIAVQSVSNKSVFVADTLTFTNPSSPSAPAVRTIRRDNSPVDIEINGVSSADLAGYRVYFDSDSPGPPYNGTAFVGGSPSPVDIGLQDSGVLEGLDSDSTYYVSATAYDVAGSESEFAPAVEVPPVGGSDEPAVFAYRRIQGRTSLEAGPTGFGARFTASDSGSVTVRRFSSSPDTTSGISEDNVSEYRWVVRTEGELSLDSTEVRLPVSSLSGIEQPAGVTIYRRTEAGSGTFKALETTVGDNNTPGEISDDTLYATARSLGEFALASDSNPLPVEMANIEASTSEDGVQLTWKTANETNNAGFAVQRQSLGTDDTAAWSKVGFVDGAGTTSKPQNYQFTDGDLPYEADSLRYRLVQVDSDGRRTKTDPVTIARGQVQELELLGTYPNPANTQATVRFAVPRNATADQDVKIELYDVLGRRVRIVKTDVESGRHKAQLNVSGLASGVYFLWLRADDATRTQKITIVR